MSAHLLVVDDDDRLRALLERYLTGEGFVVSVAPDAAAARDLAAGYQFAAAVVDVMLPDASGLELAAQLPMPILLLTALGEGEDRIKGLEAGADDYLAKPFEPRELVLRLQAILRRTAPPATINFGPYAWHPETKQLQQHGKEVMLSDGERTLLGVMVEQINHDVPRQSLADAAGIGERSVDVQITRLRRKLEGATIQSVRGVGYRLVSLLV